MVTVEDIRNVRFSVKWGGYKVVEVDDFLDRCAETLRAMTGERELLKKQIAELQNR
ncbi:MAG: DivIVA domain-containing protein [Oscillospiraceae bacterium]|nr:DivIVA domain-containing protein [Oscillospiraceae bacterium]